MATLPAIKFRDISKTKRILELEIYTESVLFMSYMEDDIEMSTMCVILDKEQVSQLIAYLKKAHKIIE